MGELKVLEVKKITGKQPWFKYRELQVHEIIKMMLNSVHNVIHLTGVRGIGKSVLAKQIQTFMCDRKICSLGSIYINCKEEKSVISIIKTLQRYILNQLDLTPE